MLKPFYTALLISACLTTSALAQDSVTNTSDASGESAVATAQLTSAGVQVASGVVAIPVVIAGSAAESTGMVARSSGEALWEAANTPLEVSPETVVAQPAPQVPYDAKTQAGQAQTGPVQTDKAKTQ
ncbi:hypothetical protein OVA03_09080 [Asticcacaulis sp. SL142]|uniref:hypothetical protein n=1 Tax=Asticcacaulis sp. SL142 TaxID=2995155 RepID=UPI00226D3055|nr:hypothetical protein [Asticcacaulis sp. SL142]WAC46870.1 hypothetical protein OVA03_09080 [Asticcacaulis sp. SL142]